MNYLDQFEKNGFYGNYGGMYIPEILRNTFEELETTYREIRKDDSFWNEFIELLKNYSGRPTPLTFAENLSAELKGAKIYLKREDLNHTGAHKMNNVLGQGLLVRKMGKSRVIAETGAGQHGVATATMAAKFGFNCTIYMGEHDIERQRPNVFWMEQLGAKVVPVTSGTRILKDAINEAFRDWVSNVENTHYVLGTACGPHPFPSMVAWLQSVIGIEAKKQILEHEKQLPKRVYACVGGGSNSLGSFFPFFESEDTELIAVEAGGKGPNSGKHAIRILSEQGQPGIAQGYATRFLQDNSGQMMETHSVSAGLDYMGISPILAFLAEEKKVRFEYATDKESIYALQKVMRCEGIIPALESSHALAKAIEEAPQISPENSIIVSLSGRADKDIFTVAGVLKDKKWNEFIRKQAEKNH